ncbi:MAG: preprotein translocase subunit SecG, partial [Chitinophagia bacterium]|nr:preprotein translocase subunit SecG [Chitinophagia bacterium]
MIYLITILLIIACVGLSFFVLIQNPKGGGLTGSFGSMST